MKISVFSYPISDSSVNVVVFKLNGCARLTQAGETAGQLAAPAAAAHHAPAAPVAPGAPAAPVAPVAPAAPGAHARAALRRPARAETSEDIQYR